MGLNHDSMDIYVYPVPLTRDSMHTAAGHIPFTRESDWYERTREWMGNRTFWDCICHVKSRSTGYCYIYIDAQSGEVLYVLDFDANAPKPWVPRKQH